MESSDVYNLHDCTKVEYRFIIVRYTRRHHIMTKQQVPATRLGTKAESLVSTRLALNSEEMPRLSLNSSQSYSTITLNLIISSSSTLLHPLNTSFPPVHDPAISIERQDYWIYLSISHIAKWRLHVRPMKQIASTITHGFIEQLRTTSTDLLKIKHPVMLAGMNVAAGPKLAAAVTNAGGLGVIGGVGYTPDMLREQIAELKGFLKDKNAPFGVDLLIPQVGGSARKTK